MEKIFVMGGGGFSMEPENPLLDLHILSLAQKARPKICFVGTASGDSVNLIQNFHNAFKKHDCVATHLSLFSPPTRDLESFILDQNIIYVGGGNTKNLLTLWKDWNVDQFLKKANKNGTVLAGLSAGMICWFEHGVTDSFGKNELDIIPGLGFLKGSACPHFDGEPRRRPYYTNAVKEKSTMSGLALDDGAGALFVNGKLQECVSSRQQANAYNVHTDGETKINISFLG